MHNFYKKQHLQIITFKKIPFSSFLILSNKKKICTSNFQNIHRTKIPGLWVLAELNEITLYRISEPEYGWEYLQIRSWCRTHNLLVILRSHANFVNLFQIRRIWNLNSSVKSSLIIMFTLLRTFDLNINVYRV